MIRNLKNRSFNKPTFALKGGSPYVDWFETNIKGIFFGGTGGSGAITTIHKCTYSTDTTTALSAVTATARAGIAGVGGASIGYFIGGYNSSNRYSNVDKVTYATDTNAVGTTFSGGQGAWRAGTGNATHGYVAGGQDSGGTATALTYIGPFSTGVFSQNAGASLTTARSTGGVSSNTYAYWGPGGDTKLDKTLFSTATTSNVSSGANASRGEYAAINNITFGVFAGGYVSSNLNSSTKIRFSTDIASVYSTMTTGRRYVAGCGTQSIGKGYVLGGYTTNYVTYADVLNFSTDTFSYVAAANLTVGNCLMGAAG